MGCGQSQTAPDVAEDKRPIERPKQNGSAGDAVKDNKRISSTDSNANRADTKTNNSGWCL